MGAQSGGWEGGSRQPGQVAVRCVLSSLMARLPCARPLQKQHSDTTWVCIAEEAVEQRASLSSFESKFLAWAVRHPEPPQMPFLSLGAARADRSADRAGCAVQETRDEILFFGIIDILTEYTPKKKVEHFCTGSMRCGADVSLLDSGGTPASAAIPIAAC